MVFAHMIDIYSTSKDSNLYDKDVIDDNFRTFKPKCKPFFIKLYKSLYETNGKTLRHLWFWLGYPEHAMSFTS